MARFTVGQIVNAAECCDGDEDEFGQMLAAMLRQSASDDSQVVSWVRDPDTIPCELIESCRESIAREFGIKGTAGYYKRILAKVFEALSKFRGEA